MQYQNLPFEHRFDWLKKNPNKALYPQATFNPRRAGLMFFVKIPLLFFKMWRSQIKQHQVIHAFAADFVTSIVPNYLAEIDKAQRENWRTLPSKDVLKRLHDLIQLTLFDFARHSLKPTALAALVLGNLERAFAARLQPMNVKPADAMVLGVQNAQAALRELMIGVHADEATDLPSAFRAVRERRLSREEFLRRFGHRGSQEMELARPRWSEDHSALDFSSHLHGASPEAKANPEDAWQLTWLKLSDEARLLPSQRIKAYPRRRWCFAVSRKPM